MRVAVALLLASTAGATNLRQLEDGDVLPADCLADGVSCAQQDDGYWIELPDGWFHREYESRPTPGNEENSYDQLDRTGTWTTIEFARRKADGGYFRETRDGGWDFHAYTKEQAEDGYGYWQEGWEAGERTYVEYDKERAEQDGRIGWNVFQLEGTMFFPDPVVEVPEEEDDEALFDAEAAEREAAAEESRRREAELAGKIVGVAETGPERRKKRAPPTAPAAEEPAMTEEQASDYYLNERFQVTDDYDFTLRLSNAKTITASAIALVSYIAISM